MIRLRFSAAQVSVPDEVAGSLPGGARVARVDGPWRGPAFVATGRMGSGARRANEVHVMAIWGESIPTVLGSVGRFGEWLDRSVLRAGFVVSGSDGVLLTRRPRYGVLPRRRLIVFEVGGGTWVLRAGWIGSTLRGPDGQARARFSLFGTSVAPDVSPWEVVIVLTVEAQRLWARVASPLAVWWTVGLLPRGGGDRFVV